MIERIAVSSSNIRSIGWSDLGGTLEVEFHQGRVYHYPHVKKADYLAFLNAPSKGRHFQAHYAHRTDYAELEASTPAYPKRPVKRKNPRR